MAEEGRRTYGRIVPARADNVYQLVMKEPVGPVAAFTPWNFPINQVVRKASAAIATGCSIIVKGPEDTPASCAELVKAFVDAGVPAGVIQLVYGVPSEISEYLIPHPIIKKVTFTGSTPVGKQLAALAGAHMKRVTMELGGHAPAIVFEDADVDQAVNILGANKFRNAGQVCVAPTRFLVHEKVYPEFVEKFTAYAKNVKVGNGLDADTQHGPARRRAPPACDGRLRQRRHRQGRQDPDRRPAQGQQGLLLRADRHDRRAAHRQDHERRAVRPAGADLAVQGFRRRDEGGQPPAVGPRGLCLHQEHQDRSAQVGAAFESGMVSINHHGLALPEVPFGGMKDSGYGSEGGIEALEAYLNTKFVTTLGM